MKPIVASQPWVGKNNAPGTHVEVSMKSPLLPPERPMLPIVNFAVALFASVIVCVGALVPSGWAAKSIQSGVGSGGR